MAIFLRLGVLLTALITLPVAANTPHPPIPDPARLAAAEQLVESLPIEAAIKHFTRVESLPIEVADGWLLFNHPEDHESQVGRVFAAEVEREAYILFDQAVADARQAMALRYARQLNVAELVAASQFASSEEGQAYFAFQLRSDEWLIRHIGQAMYARMDLDQILEEARESSLLIDRINKK